MSYSCRPLVADAIPLIDLIEKHLKSLIGDLNKPLIIHASAVRAHAVLNKYYSKTDDLKMYQICMSMSLLLYMISSLCSLIDSVTSQVRTQVLC